MDIWLYRRWLFNRAHTIQIQSLRAVSADGYADPDIRAYVERKAEDELARLEGVTDDLPRQSEWRRLSTDKTEQESSDD